MCGDFLHTFNVSDAGLVWMEYGTRKWIVAECNSK